MDFEKLAGVEKATENGVKIARLILDLSNALLSEFGVICNMVLRDEDDGVLVTSNIYAPSDAPLRKSAILNICHASTCNNEILQILPVLMVEIYGGDDSGDELTFEEFKELIICVVTSFSAYLDGISE